MRNKLEYIIYRLKRVGEKYLKFVKDNAKVEILMLGVALGGYTVNKIAPRAYGGEVKIYNIDGTSGNGVGGSVMYNQSILDANEMFDDYDALWSDAPENPEPKWLKVHSEPYGEELQFDCRPINSTSTLYTKLSVVNGSVSCPNKIKFLSNFSDLEWKNIIAERYGIDDVNDPNNIKDKWDVKYIDGEWIQLSDLNNQSGIYDNIPVKYFNHADLNCDRRVDGFDFAILGNNWGRTGIVKGSDPNCLDDYADMTDVYDEDGYLVSYGDGTVDYKDVAVFHSEYLWDANE